MTERHSKASKQDGWPTSKIAEGPASKLIYMFLEKVWVHINRTRIVKAAFDVFFKSCINGFIHPALMKVNRYLKITPLPKVKLTVCSDVYNNELAPYTKRSIPLWSWPVGWHWNGLAGFRMSRPTLKQAEGFESSHNIHVPVHTAHKWKCQTHTQLHT